MHVGREKHVGFERNIIWYPVLSVSDCLHLQTALIA